jgi:hypothetical protein
VANAKVTGVTLAGRSGGDGGGGARGEGGMTLTADVVVCAADLPWAYRNVLKSPLCGVKLHVGNILGH